jgi:hypothetical protein
MSRTAARFTQADVARSIRAAKQAGAGSVELRPDGTIIISLAGAAPITMSGTDDLDRELSEFEARHGQG